MAPQTPSATATQPPSQPLSFRPSPAASLGVELELQILDRDTGDLAPGAARILDACADEHIPGVSEEFLLCMIEVKTDVCRDVSEVRSQLFPHLGCVRNLANSLGYELASAGTHPFSRPGGNAIFPKERYQKIGKRQGWLAQQEAVFGLHVHVGVPGPEEAIGLVNLLVPYVPHLLALSANSPFWGGADTGFASTRVTQFRPAAHAGTPPHLNGWADFCRYFNVLRRAGVLESIKDVYWDLRPHPDLGTVEFRVCDAPSSLAHVLGLAALARTLVLDGLQTLRERPELGRGDPAHVWLAQENRWLAARYGLAAQCALRPGEPRRSLADDTAELLERLRPVAERSGDDVFLEAFQLVAKFESGADRQRRIFRQTGQWKAVTDDLRDRWAGELQPPRRAKRAAAWPAVPEPTVCR